MRGAARAGASRLFSTLTGEMMAASRLIVSAEAAAAKRAAGVMQPASRVSRVTATVTETRPAWLSTRTVLTGGPAHLRIQGEVTTPFDYAEADILDCMNRNKRNLRKANHGKRPCNSRGRKARSLAGGRNMRWKKDKQTA